MRIRSPRDSGILPEYLVAPRAQERAPRPRGLLPRGFCCATRPPSSRPSSLVPGDTSRAAPLALPTPLNGRKVGLPRARGESVEGLGPPRLPPGAPAPPGLRGGESCLYRSPAAAHPARLRAGAKWSVRLLQPAARTQRAGGTKHSSRRAVAQPAPRFAIRPRRRGGGGSAGFHPPRPREAARRLQRPAQAARRHGTAASPDRGSLPPAAASGPTPSPAGSGPEPPRPSPGGRPLPRPLPPPGRPRRRPSPPCGPTTPRRPPQGPGKGLGSPKLAWGPRETAGRPFQPGRSCPVSLLTSAILVPLGRTSSAEHVDFNIQVSPFLVKCIAKHF